MGDTILVWGAGGHGRVVADLVRACGGKLGGFIDADESRVGGTAEPGGTKVVYAERRFLSLLEDEDIPELNNVTVVAAVGINAIRLSHVKLLQERATAALIHPSAVVSPSVFLGRSSVVFANAVVNSSAVVHDGVIVNSAAVVEHDCVVGAGAHVSPGAVLAGGVTVGARSWIGAGATVIEGVRIGQDVIVGAGAVVLHDVPDGLTVAGVPARPLRSSSVRF